MNVFINNQGPGPVVVTDASGLRHDLGEGTHNLFRAPVRIVPASDNSIEEFGDAPIDFTPGLALDSGEFVPAEQLNAAITPMDYEDEQA